jgi:hypothetical protein
MILTISSASVPIALIPLASVADTLGVSVEQAALWCERGQLPATGHLGHWWVSVADLTRFVERSTWQLVAPPSPPAPRRRRA